jgi:membrane protease YdiL (CAAX protease family)
VNVGLYLLVSLASLWYSFRVLRNVARSEGAPEAGLSLRETLAAIGFRTRSFAGDFWAGVLGYAMTVPLIIMSSPLDLALLLLQTAVVAAVVEETMFRGVFYPALRKRWGVARAIALSGALFSLAHPTLPGGFLPLWTLGAAFAIACERRGSLIPCIVMHALNNGTLVMTQYATFGS